MGEYRGPEFGGEITPEETSPVTLVRDLATRILGDDKFAAEMAEKLTKGAEFLTPLALAQNSYETGKKGAEAFLDPSASNIGSAALTAGTLVPMGGALKHGAHLLEETAMGGESALRTGVERLLGPIAKPTEALQEGARGGIHQLADVVAEAGHEHNSVIEDLTHEAEDARAYQELLKEVAARTGQTNWDQIDNTTKTMLAQYGLPPPSKTAQLAAWSADPEELDRRQAFYAKVSALTNDGSF